MFNSFDAQHRSTNRWSHNETEWERNLQLLDVYMVMTLIFRSRTVHRNARQKPLNPRDNAPRNVVDTDDNSDAFDERRWQWFTLHYTHSMRLLCRTKTEQLQKMNFNHVCDANANKVDDDEDGYARVKGKFYSIRKSCVVTWRLILDFHAIELNSSARSTKLKLNSKCEDENGDERSRAQTIIEKDARKFILFRSTTTASLQRMLPGLVYLLLAHSIILYCCGGMKWSARHLSRSVVPSTVVCLNSCCRFVDIFGFGSFPLLPVFRFVRLRCTRNQRFSFLLFVARFDRKISPRSAFASLRFANHLFPFGWAQPSMPSDDVNFDCRCQIRRRQVRNLCSTNQMRSKKKGKKGKNHMRIIFITLLCIEYSLWFGCRRCRHRRRGFLISAQQNGVSN